MNYEPTQIFFIVFSGIILMLLMSGFIIVMVLLHRQQQLRNRQKMENLKAEYDKTMLKVEKEIQDQTLSFIGQELHDNLGQILSLAKLTLNSPDEENYSEGKRLINHAIKEVRSLSKRLNLDWVKEVKLEDFIRGELQKIEKSGLCKTQFETSAQSLALDQDKKLVLIRVIQECLNNIIKHADPSMVYISLDQKDDRLSVTVKDDGNGFDVEDSSKGMGLHNLKSRIETIGGKLTVSSIIGIGTEIKLLLPFE
ncbi:sensor histidine kinase [Echinicola vietnamensis]|uniref:histidine kinase n=1 Tax=Echinicola vietnamensis (strain DSM 17526 / LMG 23754 / KMM 6221) TaxID=926556 RepID=L0FVQ7_ECHVK|nr:ATP-binding protein [Echinicola vietnamensis]AGA77392.1 histidine kinase [Echinicola vietnamensis DSM 17526]